MAEINHGSQRAFDNNSQLIASGCDPRNLPQVAYSHIDGGFPQTFEQAIAKADLVVIAHVTKTTFRLDPGGTQPVNTFPLADTTLAVERSLKGDAPNEITLRQSGGPMAQDGGVIGIFKGDPVLLPGDRVLLLALKSTGGDGYWSSYPVGKYYIRDGIMFTPDGSPCDWLSGLGESNVIQLVQASLSRRADEAPNPAHRCDWSRF